MSTNHDDIVEVSKEKVENLFNALTNGKDHIKVEELSNRIINTNVIPEGDDVKTKDKEFDENKNGKIELKEFQNLIKYHADYLTKDGLHIKNFFNIFDGNNDRKISKEEFKSDMERV